MALAVLDGNQSATTLSSVVTGGEHIVAHSVVSLGSNAISNITTAVSGSVVTIPNLNVLARSVATEGIVDGTLNFVKIGGHQDGSNQTAHIVHVSGGGAMKVDASDSTVTFGAIRGTVTIGNTVTIAGTVTANPTGTQTIAGTVTANIPQGAFSVAGIATDEGGGQPINGVQLGYFDAVTDGYLLVNPTNPLPISGAVTANAFGLDQGDGTSNAKIPIISFDTGIEAGSGGYVVPVQISNTLGAIGTSNALPISGTVTIGSLPALAAGTANIGVVTIGNIRRSTDGALSQLSTEQGSNYLQTVVMPGTSQIGSVTASISNSVTIASLPAVSGTVTANVFGKDYDGTAVPLPILSHESNVATRGIPIGFNDNANGSFFIVGDSQPLPVAGANYDGQNIGIPLGQNGDASSPSIVVPIGFAGDGEFKRVAFDAGLPISGTVTAVNHQGTSVTTSNFTSTTPSTILASANSGREVLTIFNEGAGNLHICAGATCTTIAYQVRLSSGDYYEVPLNQTSLTHSAVFATAGTARVTEVS